ncbi:sulfatase-like hydrolase/transferase [Fulvivirga ligni]|uniref:sulfatase-like hydrolase/transferase n=1 Tax=Fulvivirga ligni TaxID=2904246 RepID=UPI001F4805BD|nr:sulfatase-like hydrolase/transferase [Fulvivirga ligni]UII20000.1 sulfatase-like hydrolase/transferase [Fulvivirga ligni]
MKLRYLIHVWSVLFAAIITVSLSASCTSSQGAGATTASKPAKRPNIVLIMSDDMGYSDLGCYGGEINTPQLDKLAQEGVRFTQFYNAARCCPTRASLISGLYPHDTGIGHMTNPPKADQQHDYNLPGYRGFLNKECATMAEVLKGAGYQTYMSGKWHLGVQKQELWPNQRGFDQFYGILAGATNYFKPVEPRQIYEQNESIEVTDPEYYTTDAFTDKAIEFINEGDQDRPFFLYLAYNAPHWPLQAPKEDIDKYRSTYKEGWEKVREDRFARMKALGILDTSWELTEADAPEWSSLPEEKGRKWR